MRLFMIALAGLLLVPALHAQEYGWVKVAQLGDLVYSLSTVEFVDSLHGWTAHGGDFIWKTSDGGSSWVGSAGSPMLVEQISMHDTLVGWCVGSQAIYGRIICSTDGGQHWAEQLAPRNTSLYGTAALTRVVNHTSGYVPTGSDTAKLVKTTDRGTTWTEATIGDTIRRLKRMQFVDSLHGWIIAMSQHMFGLLRTRDGGASWDMAATPRGFARISFVDTLVGWGVAANNLIYQTKDGGTSWSGISAINPDADFNTTSLSFLDSLRGWAFGGEFYQGYIASSIYRTTDGGFSWLRESIGETEWSFTDGQMIDRFHGWAVGTGGVVVAYRPLTGVVERLQELPEAFRLRQNYPNPFNPVTSIEYEVMKRAFVRIAVCDVSGRELRPLVQAEHEPGVYRVGFDGSGLASGVYYCRMSAGDFSETRRMVLLR